VTALGGTAPLAWTVSAGALPAGLSLAAATGIISGTPTTAGETTFTLTVTDAATPTAKTDAQVLKIKIVAAPALQITTSSLANGTVGTAYTATVAATGGIAPLSFAVTTGALPAGLSLAAATGIISGPPTAAGDFSFTVTVTDSTTGTHLTDAQALTLHINAAPAIQITTSSLANGTVNAAYTATLAATGGVAPLVWNVTVGALPAGLSLNSATGVISGTPTAAGDSAFTVTVTDSTTGTALTDTQALTIHVNAAV
jgi:hypothetical protein